MAKPPFDIWSDILGWCLLPFACCCLGLLGLCTCSIPLKHGFCGTGRLQEEQRKAMLAAYKRDTPVPLPAKRARALTLPLGSSQETSMPVSRKKKLADKLRMHRQGTCDQLQSPFFHRLPLEIRLLIYRYLFSGTIHIARKTDQRRLRQKRCHGICNGSDMVSAVCWGPRDHRPVDRISKWNEVHAREDLLSLLFSCRNVYSEAIPLLYSSPTLTMKSYDTLIDLSSTILPKRMDSVRNVSILYIIPRHRLYDHIKATWTDACGILRAMRGLQWLRVGVEGELCPGFPTTYPEEEEEALRPLMTISGVEDFEVHISWDLNNEEFLQEGVPFRLRTLYTDREAIEVDGLFRIENSL